MPGGIGRSAACPRSPSRGPDGARPDLVGADPWPSRSVRRAVEPVGRAWVDRPIWPSSSARRLAAPPRGGGSRHASASRVGTSANVRCQRTEHDGSTDAIGLRHRRAERVGGAATRARRGGMPRVRRGRSGDGNRDRSAGTNIAAPSTVRHASRRPSRAPPPPRRTSSIRSGKIPYPGAACRSSRTRPTFRTGRSRSPARPPAPRPTGWRAPSSASSERPARSPLHGLGQLLAGRRDRRPGRAPARRGRLPPGGASAGFGAQGVLIDLGDALA